jgi:hypothetical protein
MGRILILFSFSVPLFFSCEMKDSRDKSSFTFDVTNLNDNEYPDNPDIGYRSKNYEFDFFQLGNLERSGEHFDISFYSNASDTIFIENYPILEFIPTVPEAMKNDTYLSYLALVNQEWNRNQVRLGTTEFKSNNERISRIDIARNCLNAYLWEIILYEELQGKEQPFAHGWFNFPQDLYAELFEKRNGLPYKDYKEPLENWVDPACKKLALNTFRKVIDEVSVNYKDLSDTMYPLTHARLKKYKEIIVPSSFNTMRDLQSDSTIFATFSPPGIYSKLEPRTTELGRIRHLSDLELNQITSANSNDTLHEIVMTFKHAVSLKNTDITFGGINLTDLPTLSPADANKGWKSSMGFSNHSFYESLDEFRNHNSKNNPYYAFMRDENKNWLDSHKVGIDGPLLHWDSKDPSKLHIWLLSFERHALVGHYTLNILQ